MTVIVIKKYSKKERDHEFEKEQEGAIGRFIRKRKREKHFSSCIFFLTYLPVMMKN